jgi:hypothetical protein
LNSGLVAIIGWSWLPCCWPTGDMARLWFILLLSDCVLSVWV